MSQNPLASYFRQPGMHINLPTRGVFCREGELETAINGEIAVYPMTAKDEIMSKNPDALLNGFAIESIIKSCCPGVKNPRGMANPDIDYILLAIKRVTYGDAMPIGTHCPKCGTPHEFTISIEEILSTSVPTEDEYPVRLDDTLVAYVKPYDYECTTLTNLAAFEETKLLQALAGANLNEEERLQGFSNSFERISMMNLKFIAKSIVRIIGPDFQVEDTKQIMEFIDNAPKSFFKKLQDEMKRFEGVGVSKEIEMTCPNKECNHVWNSEIIFDPAHFFE